MSLRPPSRKCRCLGRWRDLTFMQLYFDERTELTRSMASHYLPFDTGQSGSSRTRDGHHQTFIFAAGLFAALAQQGMAVSGTGACWRTLILPACWDCSPVSLISNGSADHILVGGPLIGGLEADTAAMATSPARRIYLWLAPVLAARRSF